MCEHSLEHPEDGRPEAAEVSTQHMAGGRARPASSAAIRPTAPAFAVCVCRIAGRSARMIRASRKVASRSCTGEISRCRCGIVTTWTPWLSATYAIDCSPWLTVPATSIVSYPRWFKPSAR
jgi:hypothetical protein